jgi:glycosyltransferase involved in cell wall biosynthesis
VAFVAYGIETVMTLQIAMILNRYLPIIGGAERQASQLIQQLTEKGHQITVITRRIDQDLALTEEIGRITVHRLHPVGLSHQANVLMVFRLWFYLIWHAREYDIFHVHSIGPVGIATILAGKMTHTPVVIKIATAGDIVRKQDANLSKVTYIIRKYILPPKLWLTLLGQASAIVTMTDEIVVEARTHQLDRITHKISNGVDLDVFNSQYSMRNKLQRTYNISPESKIILFAGRLVQRKRIDVLLDAFHLLRQTYPHVHLLLAGSGNLQSDSVEEELHVQVKQLELQDNITFLGLIDDIPAYLQAVDIFAFPSAREGMPNVILEAMASRLPIVACKIGGVLDVVDDESAYLVPVGDVIAFADAMKQIISHPKDSQTKTNKARERAEQEFSISAVARRYEALYRRLIN